MIGQPKAEVRTISPVDGSVFLTRPYLAKQQVDAAFVAARRAQAEWAGISLARRIDAVSQGLERLLGRHSEITEALSWQMGRPISQAPGELAGVRERAEYMLAIADDALAPRPGQQGAAARREIWREPLGVVFIVTPWNYPYLTAINSIVPALVAGNAVALKPSPQTPLAGEHFEEAFKNPDIPSGLLQCLHVGPEQVLEIAGTGPIDSLIFTGSAANGAAIEKAASGRFLPLGLELGGKDPAYLRRDAAIEYAASELASGSFFNAGQSCCGIERIYVHRQIFADFTAAFAAEAGKLKPGHPLDQATRLGPVVSIAAAERIRGDIDDALSRGARLLFDPAYDNGIHGANYLPPQVLVDVDHDMRFMQEETFGPAVGIMPVESDEQALELMNDSRFGLTASVWTRDAEAAAALARRIDAGTVFTNCCDVLEPSLAWSGVKQSGRGCSLSHFGYDGLTRPKSINFRFTDQH